MTARCQMLALTIAALALLAATFVASPPLLYIWNSSDSVPLGLYRLHADTQRYVTELVAVRPPDPLASYLDQSGYLPKGLPMLKRVLALPGQTVCRRGQGIAVDDIAMGKAKDRDRAGNVLPVWQGCHVVGEGEIFVMNWQSDGSLDGRYFGMLPATAVIGRAHPVWIRDD